MATETQTIPVSELHLQPDQVKRLGGTDHALGRRATDLSTGHAEAAIESPHLADIHEEWLNKYVQSARELIETSDPQKAARLLALDELPSALRSAVAGHDAGEATPLDLYNRLKERAADGSYAIPDATFLNVLQWHNHRLSEKQARYDIEQAPAVKARFTSQVEQAVADGWLPVDAQTH